MGFVLNFEDFEGQRGEVFDWVYDIWEVIERRNKGAVMNPNYGCIDLWHASWSSRFQ